MPPVALALVVLAGLIHASWNIAAKKAGGDARFAGFTGLVMMVFWAPVGLWLAYQQIPLWGLREWLVVALSGALHLLYYLFLLRGYRLADLTVVYPVARGSGPLLSSMGAVLLLGESVTVLGLWGILCMAAGVFFIAGGWGLLRNQRDQRDQRDRRADRARLGQGLYYGVVTGFFIATYTVLDGYAVKVWLLSPILLDYVGNMFRLAWLAPTLWRDRQQLPQLWAQQRQYAIFVGVISPVSYVLVLYAMQLAPLSHVAPAREVSMLFAAVLGGQLLGEADRRSRLLGAVLMCAGVVSLSLG